MPDAPDPPLPHCYALVGWVAFGSAPGERLRTIREEYGIAQGAVADRLDVSPSVVCDYENGRRDHPSGLWVARYVTAVVGLATDAPGTDAGHPQLAPSPFASSDGARRDHVPGAIPPSIADAIEAAWDGSGGG